MTSIEMKELTTPTLPSEDSVLYIGTTCLNELRATVYDLHAPYHNEALRTLLHGTDWQAVGTVVCACCGYVAQFSQSHFAFDPL